MSKENVEVLRKVFEAMNSGVEDAVLEFLSPDVRMYPTSEWPDDEVYRGHDGVMRLGRAWTGNFDDFRWEVHEIQEVGSQVLALVEMNGRMKDSGVAIREAWAVVVSDFRDGKIGEWRFFRSQQQALKAVGLQG